MTENLKKVLLLAGLSAGGGGSSVVVDPTLTQPGQAADAKVVGDKISEQQTDIAEKMGLDQGVRFDAEQTLTDAQKAQAQQNIGVDFLTVVDGKICIVYEKEDDEE